MQPPNTTSRANSKPTRRQVLQLAGATFGSLALRQGLWAGSTARQKLPVAAVVTVYKRNSHADVLVGKILEGFRQDGGPGPDLELVAMYVDQTPPGDLSVDLAKQHGFRLAKTIDEALTLGTDKLQVAGVLSVGEHGDYPTTKDTGQKMYPRRRFFDAVAAAMRRVKQTCPVFNDKHLAYRWADAQHMVQTARQAKIPFLAGSSLPVAWRRPDLNLEVGSQIQDALAVGYGGLESYGFHALETLQCVFERRNGGETGVAAVQAITGDDIVKTRGKRWSPELLAAVLKTMPGSREPNDERLRKSTAYLIDYRDGRRATVMMAGGSMARNFGVGVQIRGSENPAASWFQLEEDKPYGHFAWLLDAIEQMIHTGRPPYPVQRTLLTTGILDAAMHSRADQNRRLETPQLEIDYQPTNWHHAGGELGSIPE